MRSNLFRSRIGRIVVLVLAILSLPGTGLGAVHRPHCTTHPGSSPGHHQAASVHTGMLQPGIPHECPHCPATECANQVPCTGSNTLLVSAGPVPRSEPSSHRVTVSPLPCTVRSRTHQPPTPPPQLDRKSTR